ncbi:hypothetical protein [Sanguibacter sp. HDW7]|uniref:hypothetical protein n=1 Tax=Sanguibacter sp. HDW7 TaxID=2714931 RepID=UPI00140DF4E9|nr:hypothetical protein [Sanguibacter sp. HDW7]QIK84631.1 hypothetical protein G7063_14175 [Sanguibacter sp. HDW7]
MTDDHQDDAPLDAAASLALIDAQRATVVHRAEPSPTYLFTVWGLAWLLGYGALGWGSRTHDGPPGALAGIIFGVLLLGAAVATGIHIARRAGGVRGPSARAGAMFGWTWTIGFAAVYLIMAGLTRAGASDPVLSLAWNALPAFLVGLLYLAGGALWQEMTMYLLGAWIVLVAGAATLAGIPGNYTVMALAGGGGMLGAALVSVILARRRRGLP